MLFRSFQRTRRLHRAERGEHHRDPALVIRNARPGGEITLLFKALERAVGFEHGIDMPDQQQPPALTRMRGDEVPGAAGVLVAASADRRNVAPSLAPRPEIARACRERG